MEWSGVAATWVSRLGPSRPSEYHCRVDVRFYIDPETGEPHIYKHAVSEEEVEGVLRYPGDDLPGRRDSRLALGQTQEGRTLQVVYVLDPDRRGVFVITAYELRGKALAAYRRRRKRKKS